MNQTRCGRKQSCPCCGFMVPFSWDTFVFFLKWGENVFLGTTIVNASIVPAADDRRLNEYRKPPKKIIYRNDLSF
jgi:hypothetical protein